MLSKLKLFLIGSLTICFFISPSTPAHGKTLAMTSTPQKFKDVFITAGYTTLLGLGVSGALIGLQKEPKENIHWLAYGASAGFLTGAIFGSFLVFTSDIGRPSRSRSVRPSRRNLPPAPHELGYQKKVRWSIHPTLQAEALKINGLNLAFNVDI